MRAVTALLYRFGTRIGILSPDASSEGCMMFTAILHFKGSIWLLMRSACAVRGVCRSNVHSKQLPQRVIAFQRNFLHERASMEKLEKTEAMNKDDSMAAWY